MSDEYCPGCGRKKAKTLEMVIFGGNCPKWWAPDDPDAQKDCENIRKRLMANLNFDLIRYKKVEQYSAYVVYIFDVLKAGNVSLQRLKQISNDETFNIVHNLFRNITLRMPSTPLKQHIDQS